MLPETPIFVQHFISWELHFAFGFVSQTGPLHFQFSVRQLDTAAR
jgi:hypothetical protein